MTFQEAIDNFISKLYEREVAHHAKNFPNVPPSPFSYKVGKTYVKVIHNGSAFCFVKKDTGGILKAASWSSPDPKKHERGNIFNEDPLKGTTPYGVVYRNGW